VALDDALEVQERPNMPGTTTEWPNWCVPLPMSLEELLSDERLLALAAVMQRGRQRSPAPGPDKESGLP
jgi:4-alpha-glucanotransferase